MGNEMVDLKPYGRTEKWERVGGNTKCLNYGTIAKLREIKK